MPLRGRRIVVTRAREQAGEIVAHLRALGAEPVECPSISIEPLRDPAPLDEAIARLALYDWVIFTSVNGVTHFAARLAALGMDSSILCERQVGAIGPATRSALERLGCRPDFMPDEYVAEAIVAQIGSVKGKRVLLPRADIAREALADGLRSLGAEVDEVAAYRTVRGDSASNLLARLRERSLDAITFTSSSTVRFTIDGLVDAGAGRSEAVALLNTVDVVCIGPVTAETARRSGLVVTATSDEYTVDGLIASLVGLYARPQKRGT
jgi:uroporphyrinogen III methyltransferase/synthase